MLEHIMQQLIVQDLVLERQYVGTCSGTGRINSGYNHSWIFQSTFKHERPKGAFGCPLGEWRLTGVGNYAFVCNKSSGYTYDSTYYCSTCGNTLEMTWCNLHESYRSSTVNFYALCEKQYGMTCKISCTTCGGSGSVQITAPCTHGYTSPHYYCSHGNGYTTNYHS